MWVARTIGPEGITVFGAIFIIEFVATNISNYLMTSLSIRLSFLFGEGRGCEGSQIYIDFIRLALILGVLVPVCVLPATKPLVMWFGADDRIGAMCLQYMIPITAGCFFNFLYTMACGVLQAAGRSYLFGFVQFACIVANMAIFDPLFLVALRMPIWGASLATILAEGIPGVVLTILICMGKFALTPEKAMLRWKPSPETYKALKVGLGSLASNLSYVLPLLLLQKYVNMAASAVRRYETVLAVWAVIEKLYQLVSGICSGFQNGFLPAAAFAFGAERLNRLVWLFFHATWFSTVLSVLLGLIIVIIPGQVASMWDSDPEFIKWARAMLPKAFYTAPCVVFQYMVPALLQAMQRVWASSTVSIITMLLPMPIFSSIMYFTGKEDPARMLWSYTLNDSWSLLASAVFVIAPLRALWKAPKDGEIDAEEQPGQEEDEAEAEQPSHEDNAVKQEQQ